MFNAVCLDAAWFAVRVRPNHERAAERSLHGLGLEAYLPLHRVRRRWSDRIKEIESVLFPGYVFCRFGYPDRMRVLNSAGVRSIVSNGKDPLPVDDSEIAAVRALLRSGRPILPSPYMQIGQRVVIRDGPLASLRGVVVRARDAWRVVVSVEAINCSIAIEVDSAAVARDVN
jgi:transcription antitermination factor NusG